MVQRQSQQEVVTAALRAVPVVARSVMLALLLFGAGCGKTEPQRAGSRRADSAQAQAPVAVLRGETSGILVCVTPLSADPRTADWYQEKIAEFSQSFSGRTFLRLSLFHLGGPDSAPLKLDRLELTLATPGGEVRAMPLRSDSPNPRLAASTLPHKALESFLGAELPAGDFLAAITSLPGEVDLGAVQGGVLWAGDREIRLIADSLDRPILEELLEFPRREAILASLAGSGAESQTSVPEESR